MSDNERIANIFLDEHTVIRRSPQIEHERQVAIFDLLEDNSFKLNENQCGPYDLHLSVLDNRLIFDVRGPADKEILRFSLPASTFRRVIRDYFLVCESYFQAIKTKTPSQIEAIDMGRRGLHDEGAEILSERLSEQVSVDKQTARRLFTLVCVLHIRA
jgi:uncharacterized protein (UPF0262 family)